MNRVTPYQPAPPILRPLKHPPRHDHVAVDTKTRHPQESRVNVARQKAMVLAKRKRSP